jgi:hypothetical protein
MPEQKILYVVHTYIPSQDLEPKQYMVRGIFDNLDGAVASCTELGDNIMVLNLNEDTGTEIVNKSAWYPIDKIAYYADEDRWEYNVDTHLELNA